jgi:hypothetical protein
MIGRRRHCAECPIRSVLYLFANRGLQHIRSLTSSPNRLRIDCGTPVGARQSLAHLWASERREVPATLAPDTSAGGGCSTRSQLVSSCGRARYLPK